MIKNNLNLLFYLVFILTCQKTISQSIDSTSFKINSRLSFYSFEKSGELLLHVPSSFVQKNISVIGIAGNDTLINWKGKPSGDIIRLPFSLKLAPSSYNAVVRIIVQGSSRTQYQATTKLIVLPYKINEVKTDRLTGGLIVNRRQFYPFGFYCYSPVYPTMAEEEVVRGFNMMSPYQKILPETLNERKAYMDRCAELGMKVHYNLLSVSGGGGVSSIIEDMSDEEKRARLVSEIKTFMDHPALLGWYISDEPNGYKIPPEILEEIYSTVKENDPWHPVSIVFMTPFLSSKEYVKAFDVVMADPYPVPNYPITMVGNVAGQLTSEYTGKRPVWMVIQSFGGGEWWGREPTPQEIRSMTWQSIIKGAGGIQYFVRQGPNYFPKSSSTWNECGSIALEVAELTPWLLSDEATLPVESKSANVIVSSRIHNGKLLVMAVNKINKPVSSVIRISGLTTGRAKLLFENRSIDFTGGVINDQLSPYGSQAYLINLKPEKKEVKETIINLIKDPGFESAASPGIPEACYARPGGDRGATYFLDTREHFEGNHSVRLITPSEDKGVSLRLFPFQVKAGESYSISLWAKSDPEQRFYQAAKKINSCLYEKKELPQYVEVSLGGLGKARFVPDSIWRRFVTFVTIPTDTLPSFKTNLILKMPGQGVAWFDQLKVFEEK